MRADRHLRPIQHCKAMVPELSKAALGLYPLIPVYAVDCDDKQNQQLCAREVCARSRICRCARRVLTQHLPGR
jgi:hypothetical protein